MTRVTSPSRPPHRRASLSLSTDPSHDSSHEPSQPRDSGSDIVSDGATRQVANTLPSLCQGARSTDSDHSSTVITSQQQCRGKTTPIESFSGEDPAITVDDWLPSLEWASDWNWRSEAEKRMQLPGYLQGRACQEWKLLSPSEQQDFTVAINTLRARLDPGRKTMAAQEFRHTLQKVGETVPDFIRRMERHSRSHTGKTISVAPPETRCSMASSMRD